MVLNEVQFIEAFREYCINEHVYRLPRGKHGSIEYKGLHEWKKFSFSRLPLIFAKYLLDPIPEEHFTALLNKRDEEERIITSVEADFLHYRGGAPFFSSKNIGAIFFLNEDFCLKALSTGEKGEVEPWKAAEAAYYEKYGDGRGYYSFVDLRFDLLGLAKWVWVHRQALQTEGKFADFFKRIDDTEEKQAQLDLAGTDGQGKALKPGTAAPAKGKRTTAATAAKVEQASKVRCQNVDAMYKAAKDMHKMNPDKEITRGEMKTALAEKGIKLSEHHFREAWKQIPAGWKHPGGHINQ